MEKTITIAHRYWGNANRHAKIIVCNNKVSIQGYALGYRNREVLGPKLENIAEVPKKLRKEVQAIKQRRCVELSKAFSAFTAEIWQKAQALDPWFDY